MSKRKTRVKNQSNPKSRSRKPKAGKTRARSTKARAHGSRALWNGAVSFGLVHIPVHLHSAARDSALDLDLLDQRDFSPVGYQRYNKRTGKVVDWDEIVKGYQYKKGEYVALSDEDFRKANVEATQTIEIVSFTERQDIPPEFYETPYFLEPVAGGDKAYALLREALLRSDKVAIGSFVMRGRQHFCAILAHARELVVNTLRFAEELRPAKELDLPPANARSAKISPRELSMAERLIEGMSQEWKPDFFKDTYRADLMKRIKEKIRKKQTHVLTPPEEEPAEERKSAEIIDLMAVLQKSLEKRGGKPAAKNHSRRKAA